VEIAVPGSTNAPGVTVLASILELADLDPSRLDPPPVMDFSTTAVPGGRPRGERDGPSPLDPRAGHEAFFDREAIAPPLVLRSPEPGDRMRPFGMTGSKKLSDIFIDKKIPAGERPTSLVIADAHDILWLVGVATSEKCRIRNETRKIVHIRVARSGKDSWSG
jgi:tRNA(Ile)-lysidine synthetase-like protein